MKAFSESMYLDNKYQHSTKGLFNMIPFSINSFFLIFLPFLYFIIREKIIIIYQKEISIDLIVSFFWIMLLLFELYYYICIKGKAQYETMAKNIKIYTQLRYETQHWEVLLDELPILLSKLIELCDAPDILLYRKREDIIHSYTTILKNLCSISRSPSMPHYSSARPQEEVQNGPFSLIDTIYSFLNQLNPLPACYLSHPPKVEDSEQKFKECQEIILNINILISKNKELLHTIEDEKLSIFARIYYRLYSIGNSQELIAQTEKKTLEAINSWCGTQLDVTNEIRENAKKNQEQMIEMATTLKELFVSTEDSTSVQKEILKTLTEGKKIDVKTLVADKSADIVVSGLLAALPQLVPYLSTTTIS